MRQGHYNPEALLGADNPDHGGSYYARSKTHGERLMDLLQQHNQQTQGDTSGGNTLGMVGLGATVLFGMLALL